jgi:hypothetical protein
MKNPLKSPLLWGTYDVVYCSKPSAVGGPLTKGAGPVVAAGQQARQILQEPGTLVNEVTFKTLGLLPGFSRQYGQIQPLSGDTFLVRREGGREREEEGGGEMESAREERLAEGVGEVDAQAEARTPCQTGRRRSRRGTESRQSKRSELAAGLWGRRGLKLQHGHSSWQLGSRSIQLLSW